MRKTTIKASIKYTMKSTNPDLKYVNNPREVFTFTDTYTLDHDLFEGVDAMKSWIKRDLSCVANGGYDYGEKHINIIGFDFILEMHEKEK